MSNNDNTQDTNTTPETAYEIVQRKKKKWPFILGTCIAGAAAIAIPVIFLRPKTVDLSEYVSVVYDGISGYATPRGVVDTEGLYNALAGEEKDTAKLEAYKNFADSVAANVSGQKVSNGDSLEVNVTFNEEFRNNTGYKVSDNTTYTVTAEGIDQGRSVNLFEDATIDITGISPDAVIKVENKSADEYLKTLVFYTDKETVANGDNVILRCNVTDDELAEHGFIATDLGAVYEVEGLSEYITATDVTKSIADSIEEEDKKIIETETSDDKYRMIYKLTKNADYLSVPNSETAEEIGLQGLYLLKRNPETDKQGNPENYIVAVYKAKIKVQDKEETGYFAFTYPESYVTADGKVEINSDTLVDTLQMNTDLNALTDENVLGRNGAYQVIRIES